MTTTTTTTTDSSDELARVGATLAATATAGYEHLDGEPCASGPERHDDALCAEHGRLFRAVAA